MPPPNLRGARKKKKEKGSARRGRGRGKGWAATRAFFLLGGRQAGIARPPAVQMIRMVRGHLGDACLFSRTCNSTWTHKRRHYCMHIVLFLIIQHSRERAACRPCDYTLHHANVQCSIPMRLDRPGKCPKGGAEGSRSGSGEGSRERAW